MLRRCGVVGFKIREPGRRILKCAVCAENQPVLLQRLWPVPQLFQCASQKVADTQTLLARCVVIGTGISKCGYGLRNLTECAVAESDLAE